MDWFYTGMLQMHQALAWASLVLFAARGLTAQFRLEWADDDRLRAISFGIHFLLAISGLSMWGLLHYNPLNDGWLAAKLLAIAAYAFCAHWTVKSRELSLPAFVAGLLLLAYALRVSFVRDPGLGLL